MERKLPQPFNFCAFLPLLNGMYCCYLFYELCMAKYCKYVKAKFMFSVYLGKHMETKKKAAIKIIKLEIMGDL